MSSYITYRIKNAVIVLVIIKVVTLSMLCLCGCCRKQYTQHTSSVVMQDKNTIDTYLFKGVKHYVFDTTIIVVSSVTGDTLSKDHRTDSRYYQADEREQESTSITQNDTTIYVTETIVKNELNKPQRFFFWFGIISMILIIGYIIYKIFKIFRV